MSATTLPGLNSTASFNVAVTENTLNLSIVEGTVDSDIQDVNALSDVTRTIRLIGGTDVAFTTETITYNYDWSSDTAGGSSFGGAVATAGYNFGDAVKTMFDAVWQGSVAKQDGSIEMIPGFNDVAWGLATADVNTKWLAFESSLDSAISTNSPSATLGDAYDLADTIGDGTTLGNADAALFTASAPALTMTMATLISSLVEAADGAAVLNVINNNSNLKNILLDSKSNSNEGSSAAEVTVNTSDDLAAYQDYIHPSVSITYSIAGDQVSGAPTKSTTLTDWGSAANINSVMSGLYTSLNTKTITHQFVLADSFVDNVSSTLNSGDVIDSATGSITRSSSAAGDSATLTIQTAPVEDVSIDNADIGAILTDAGIDNTELDYSYDGSIAGAGVAGTFTLTITGKSPDAAKMAVEIVGGDSSGSVYLLG